MDDIGKCPVMHGSVTTNSGVSTTNRDWWPNQLNLSILHQNDKRSNPMSLDFDYREEFKKLDYQALKKDLHDLKASDVIKQGDGLPKDSRKIVPQVVYLIMLGELPNLN